MPSGKLADINTLLLAFISLLLTVCLWLGSQFASDTRAMLTAHESRIDGIETKMASACHEKL